MKLAIITVYPPVDAPEANHALHLSEQLALEGIDVHVICQKGAIPATKSNISIYPVMENWSFSEIGNLNKALRSIQPDAVFLIYLGWVYKNSMMVTALPSIVKRAGINAPFICQIEALEAKKIEQSAFKAAIRKIASYVTSGSFHPRFGTLLSKSDKIITLSEPHKNALIEEESIVGEKTVVIPPPPLIRQSKASTAQIREKIRKKYGIETDAFVFLFWGYIYPGKGLDSLLFAFENLHRKEPKSHLLIAGGRLKVSHDAAKDEEYYSLVKKLPEKLGISESVTWTGPFDWDSESGSEFMHASDTCVLPIDWGVTLNNSSLAAAATHKLPIIATKGDVGVDSELVHGTNIFLCEPRDSEALAKAMDVILNKPIFRKQLASGAEKLAAEWHNWPSVAKKIVREIELATKKKEPNNTTENSDKVARAKLDYTELSNIGKNNRRRAKPRTPLVSVILAAYNVEKYLAQCLDSLVYQTLDNIEIIAVDDASTDNTRDILMQYCEMYPNLRVIGIKSNVGLASVRNVGLAEAKGEYIAFIDGDDWADIRMCEKLYDRAHLLDADVVIASATIIYDNESKNFAPLFDHLTRKRISPFAKNYCFKLEEEPLAMQLEMVAWTKIYNAEFLRKNKLDFLGGLNSYEDTLFHIKCLVKAENITVIDDPVVFYRQNRPGQISSMTGKDKYQIFEIFRVATAALKEWNVPEVVWGQIIRTQLRHLDWMYNERVHSDEKKQFMRAISKCLQEIPRSAWRGNHYWGIRPAAQSIAMRRGWGWAYELTKTASSIPSRLLVLSSLKTLLYGDIFDGEYNITDRSRLPHLSNPRPVEKDAHSRPVKQKNGNAKKLKNVGPYTIGVHKVNDQELFLVDPGKIADIGNAIWRASNDHLLTQFCTFRENDIIVDIGAHLGIGAIFLAKKFPFIKVVAVEPDARKFRLMEKNVEINNIENIKMINAAISGTNGTARLYRNVSSEDWSTLNVCSARLKHHFFVQNVETMTCAKLFKNFEISECRMLKIEAWGSVKDILETFPNSVPVDYLSGETHLDDCNEASLLAASSSIARQYFWRTWKMKNSSQKWSILQQLPKGPWKNS